jgi:hypothetical protein
MAAVAGVTGVLLIAGLGIFLAFTGTQRSETKSAPVNDQEKPVSGALSIPTPGRSPSTGPSTAPSTGPSTGPDARTSEAPSTGPSADSAAGPSEGPDGVSGLWSSYLNPRARMPHVRPGEYPRVRTGPTPSPARPKPVKRPGADRRETPAEPARAPHPPSRHRPAPKAEVRPQAPPQHQERRPPAPQAQQPQPPLIMGADPCSTFHDFRRGPCYRMLDSLMK